VWSATGAAAFSLVVIYLFRSGRVYDARTEEGHLKQRMSLRGLLTMLSFMALVVAFITMTNVLSLVCRGIEPRFWSLFGLNLSLILVLIVYDSLVIDWLIIGHWRPRFLNLPKAMDKEQMKEHIRRTFIVGPLFALLLALLSAGATALLW
jgi:hypothetical protein